MPSKISVLRKELEKIKNPKKAQLLAGFFKTGRGEYGEGDKFLGVIVPKQRLIAKKLWPKISLAELQKSLNSEWHEERLTALIILTLKYKKADEAGRAKIFRLYLKNTKRVNNWDLVDLSAPNIVGNFLQNKGRKILFRLAKSKNLWERRIAVLATFQFIRHHDFKDALKIAEILIADKHDLIHKAVGWMLREIGKRNLAREEAFLKKHHLKMPRVMLRYAIEKFTPAKKRLYLAKK